MNIRKLFVLFLWFLCSSLAVFAQNTSLRSVVAVVKPNFSESSISFLEKFSSSLKENGYIDASNRLKSYIKGGFGSGFVYTCPQNGRNYIITNKHVVVQAESANVEFLLEDQSVRAFNKCKILAMDDNSDLAILELPLEAKFDKVIPIASAKPSDGDDVFTVGYPALADKPSWQMGKGIISNSSLKIEEIVSDGSTLIQHTAQIDPGSSGGPLLVKNKEGEFQIVGINTWKAKGRESVNLAIPVSAVIKMVDNYLSDGKNGTKERLESTVSEFIKSKNDGYKKILPFVSYEYISHISVDAFFELFASTNEKIKDEVVKNFNDGFPIEGIRIVIAEAISKNMLNKQIDFSSIQNFTSDGQVDVVLNYGGKEEKSAWISQFGHWLLTDFPALKVNAEWKKGICNTFGYSGSVGFMTCTGKNGFSELIFQRSYYTYWLYNVGLIVGGGILGVEAAIGGELPYRISKNVYIIPFMKGFGGMDIEPGFESTKPSGIRFGIHTGTEVAISVSKHSYLLIGAGIKPRFYLMGFDTDGNKPAPQNNFAMHIGLTF